jgi:hypothetical protein
MELIWLAFSEKIKDGCGGFFLGNWASSVRKISKIWALWGKVNFWYNSFRASKKNKVVESFLGICNIWSMVSEVIVNKISPVGEAMALWPGK